MPDLDNKTLRILAGLEGWTELRVESSGTLYGFRPDSPGPFFDQLERVAYSYAHVDDLLRVCGVKGWGHHLETTVHPDAKRYQATVDVESEFGDDPFAALLGAMLKAAEQEPRDG